MCAEASLICSNLLHPRVPSLHAPMTIAQIETKQKEVVQIMSYGGLIDDGAMDTGGAGENDGPQDMQMGVEEEEEERKMGGDGDAVATGRAEERKEEDAAEKMDKGEDEEEESDAEEDSEDENTATATDGEQRNAEGDQNGKDEGEDGDINSKSIGEDTTEGVDGGEIVVTDSQGDAETTSVGKRKRDEAEDDVETSAGKKKVCEMLNTTCVKFLLTVCVAVPRILYTVRALSRVLHAVISLRVIPTHT